MNYNKIISDLQKKVSNLDLNDDKVSILKFEIEMYIRKFIQDSTLTEYINKINTIEFYPPYFGQPIDRYEEMTYWNSGKRELIGLLEVIKGVLLLEKSLPSFDETKKAVNNNKVFIVHGHDEAMKLEVKNTLQTLGLEPIILHEQNNNGKTIIEKFESESEKVNFAVVLLSPDDVGKSALNTEGEPVYRARQNVILELGYFTGRLGRDRTFNLVKQPPISTLEQPSDFAGVVYTEYDNGGGWKLMLSQALKYAGYNINFEALIK